MKPSTSGFQPWRCLRTSSGVSCSVRRVDNRHLVSGPLGDRRHPAQRQRRKQPEVPLDDAEVFFVQLVGERVEDECDFHGRVPKENVVWGRGPAPAAAKESPLTPPRAGDPRPSARHTTSSTWSTVIFCMH